MNIEQIQKMQEEVTRMISNLSVMEERPSTAIKMADKFHTELQFILDEPEAFGLSRSNKKLPLQKEWNQRKKLRAEGNKLRAEGDLIFLNAVIEKYGNISLKWEGETCTLENGDVYE